MKTTLAAIAVAGCALLNAAGQGTPTPTTVTNQPGPADLPNVVPTLPQREFESIVHFRTNSTMAVPERDFKVDGVLPRMARSKQPWQFINPWAPAEYGTGLENVSSHPFSQPITHRTEGGISLLTIHF